MAKLVSLDNLTKFKELQDAVIKGVGDKVDVLVGTDDNKSVRAIASEELAAKLIPAGAKESLDTLEEIAQWIQDHPDDASTMNSDIAALKAVSAGIGGAGEKATVKEYVDDKVAEVQAGSEAVTVTAYYADGEKIATITVGTKATEIKVEVASEQDIADLF